MPSADTPSHVAVDGNELVLIKTSAAWGAGKLDHQACGYGVPTFQNSEWIRTCTHHCWIQLSMGTCDTQWHTKHKVAFNWTRLQSVATVLWLPQTTTRLKKCWDSLLSRSSTVGAIIWHLIVTPYGQQHYTVHERLQSYSYLKQCIMRWQAV